MHHFKTNVLHLTIVYYVHGKLIEIFKYGYHSFAVVIK